MLRFFALLLVLLAATGCDRGATPEMINRPAPVFTITDSGQKVSLQELRGKVVVLNFWATWCPPCVEEMPSLVDLQGKMRDKVTVLAVSLDEDEQAYKDFLRDYQIDLLTIRDKEQASNTLYGSFRFPETYIIDREGVLRRKFVGPVNWTSPEIVAYLEKL